MNDLDTLIVHTELHLVESPEFRAKVLACLARTGVYRVPREELTYYRVQAVLKLLRSGMQRAEAHRVIMERFGVSRRTAYRWMDWALNRRQGRLFD